MGSKLSRPPSRPPLPSAIAYKESSPPPPPPPYQGISDDKDPLRVINAPMVATERKNSISEDALEMLRKYDILVLVDDSGSMSYDGHRSWNEVTFCHTPRANHLLNHFSQARAALSALAEKAGKYDTDGIDVCFLNSKRAGERLKASLRLYLYMKYVNVKERRTQKVCSNCSIGKLPRAELPSEIVWRSSFLHTLSRSRGRRPPRQ